jgi:L-amino acid N-acyltransferase
MYNAEQIIIRDCEESDLPAILEIYNEAILNTTALFEYKIFTAERVGDWFKKKKEDNFPVFVAGVEDKMAGFGTYGHFRDRPAYKYTVESTVYVHTNYRGQGIGKLMVSSLIDYAIQSDLHAIIAGIEATNISSIHLHRNLGFMQVAEFKQVGFKFNRWLDVIFLELVLSTPRSPKENE